MTFQAVLPVDQGMGHWGGLGQAAGFFGCQVAVPANLIGPAIMALRDFRRFHFPFLVASQAVVTILQLVRNSRDISLSVSKEGDEQGYGKGSQNIPQIANSSFVEHCILLPGGP
jgi:hypothetical protein